jgi:hypothetical protein
MPLASTSSVFAQRYNSSAPAGSIEFVGGHLAGVLMA